jgi:teichuronic acid biosynthesis glycosyltransferase TuaC
MLMPKKRAVVPVATRPNASVPKRIIAYSSLFPSAESPNAGVFIKERLVRLSKRLPVCVVAPVAWSPFDWIIRLKRPDFRPRPKAFEVMEGVEVFRPKFLSFPGVLKGLDGVFMAFGTRRLLGKLVTRGNSIIDAHFLYPDGYAATANAKALKQKSVITLRGSKDSSLMGTELEKHLRSAALRADHLISVSRALVDDVAVKLVGDALKVTLVGNGVDLKKFSRKETDVARQRLGLEQDSKLLLSVGNVVPLKGFHRLVECMPELLRWNPKLILLIVGHVPAQGSNMPELRAQIKSLNLSNHVRFIGRQTQEELAWYYSAADLFVLATQYEGWANVFLEAMACGLPVVTTRVGGNAEVLDNEGLGTLVEFWDAEKFTDAIKTALSRNWDLEHIINYAKASQWDQRIDQLLAIYGDL